MNRGHGCALFGREFVDFGCGNAVIQLVDDFHRECRVIDLDFRPLAFHSLQDFIKTNCFQFSIAFRDIHFIF